MEQKAITKANKILHDLNFDEHRTTTQIVAEGLQEYAKEQLRINGVEGQSEQFNCFGGNHAKGIKPCSEWCGEDMCQKPSK